MGKRLRALSQLIMLALSCWVFVLVLGNAADWPALSSKAWQFIEKSSPIEETESGEEVAVELGEVLVTRVIDGDTIEIEGGERVRYIGIDAPEERGSDGSECYAREASEAHRILVEGQRVRLESDTRDRDRYGRLLRYVWVDDVLINVVLVREGFARQSSYPPDDSRDAELRQVEEIARVEGAGLWGACQGE